MAHILKCTNVLPDEQLEIPWVNPEASQMVQEAYV